jgi:hypothetical protein
VRILGTEDHLRYMCVHMLQHGAYRGLWLCDVAVVLESLPKDFDWAYLLQGDRRCSDWVASTVGLAHQLLGVRLDGIPPAERTRPLPRWLLPSVLRQWSIGEHYMDSVPSMGYALRHPTHLLKALRLRWPNPIQATVRVGGPFNELPRLPFQLAECVSRTTYFITQVPSMVRQRSLRPVGGWGTPPIAKKGGGRGVGNDGTGRPSARCAVHAPMTIIETPGIPQPAPLFGMPEPVDTPIHLI